MDIKHIVAAVLSALLCLSLYAQSMRTVSGSVVDANGYPIAGAVVSEKGRGEICRTGEDGRFTVSVAYSVRYLTASAEMYMSADAEVDGSFIVFRLKADQNAVRAKKEAEEQAKAAEKAKAEAQARAEEQARLKAEKEEQARLEAEKAKAEAQARAEEQARIQAEKEAKAAEERRIKEAAAQAKADEQARIQAEKEAKAAEERRIKEAAAQAKADEQARIQAEKEAKAAEERRIKEAAAQAKAEEQARIQAEKEAKAAEERKIKEAAASERKRLDDEYGKKYRNKGLINSVELSYGYQLAKGEVIYTNLGYYGYGNLSPVSVDYMIGYRFNRSFSLSAGAGFCYSLSSVKSASDSFDAASYGEISYCQYDVPVFLNGRAYFGRGKVQPMVSVSGGWYLMSNTLMADAGVGCAFRFGRIFNMYILASVRTTPWPSFQGPSWEGYKPAVTPGLRIGFML